jgi:hypothetical protein
MRLAGCSRVRWRLDASGPAAARERHGAHLERCARCREAVLAAEAVEALLRDPEAGAGAAVPTQPVTRPRVLLAAAAGLAAALLLAVLLPHGAAPPARPGLAPTPPAARPRAEAAPAAPEPSLTVLDARRGGEPADLTVLELPSGEVVLFLR